MERNKYIRVPRDKKAMEDYAMSPASLKKIDLIYFLQLVKAAKALQLLFLDYGKYYLQAIEMVLFFLNLVLQVLI